MSFLIKKRGEVAFSSFFIKCFNLRYNLDYRILENKEENIKDPDIDVYAVAEKNETLNLQVKTGEPELEQFWGSRKRHGSGMVVIDGNIEERLKQIINDAEKHYSTKGELILLIGEKMEPTFDNAYVKLISKKYEKSGFRGIYIVKLPFDDTIHPYEGQIVAIKDILGNSGKIF